jgi:hypothetical protein
VDELVDLTGCGDAWGMRVLRRNVELARLSPETLASADNQLDFVEELVDAIWDPADAGFRYAVRPGRTPDETCRRNERRRAIVERLDLLTEVLCRAVESWREALPGAPEAGSISPG